jgi:ABC-type glutathione transport system ATPase component
MISIDNLTVAFGGKEAVSNVSMKIEDGEILGVVGESGSGKSVSALTLMGLENDEASILSGRICLDENVLLDADKPRDKALIRSMQGKVMSMIFQEPMTSLNPTQKVGRQVEEMLDLHMEKPSDKKALVLDTFRSVGLHDVEKVYKRYPHELSGGMRQRVMIAMAVILHPKLIIADEPTTALDVTIQNQIIELLKEINQREKNSMLFITHDLNLARRICHRIVVMKDGRVVESSDTEAIFGNPQDAYTKRLIEAVPSRVKKKVTSAVNKTKNESGKKSETELSVDNVLEVRDLCVYYRDSGNSLFSGNKKHCVVENADFDIKSGEVLGLVGESGCGKTSLSKAILGMNRNISGSIHHNSVYPQMIFQDPYSSLNPSKTIGWLLKEPLRALGELEPSRKMTRADMEAAAYDMLKTVGIKESYFNRKPSQLSGGQRQRISIGQALITRPSLVIADEPVSALDVTLQAQIMELMLRLKEEMGLSYLFISHDINVIYQMCDRIMVMKSGRIVECGDTEEIFTTPKDDYTKLLLAES